MKTLLLAAAIAVGATPCLAQGARTSVRPGFNLFTVEQDVEIGRTSAAQAEQQLPMLNDAAVDAYLNQIISRLAANAPGARYPYHIKAVNATDINAFALPGGPMYVNRGLITAASNEAELAGVLAHELSHVALRHGTHQASNAYLAQAGLGILGGLIGRDQRTADIVNAIGGLGLNAVFLKFSRNAEYQADQTGAEIMARAGYNPSAMADFFQKLRAAQGRDPSKLEQFFSDHPAAADREARIRTLARSLPVSGGGTVGGLAAAQASLGRLPSAPTQTAARNAAPSTTPTTTARENATLTVPAASTRQARFQQPGGFFTIDHPDNWRAYAANSGLGVTIVPEGGVARLSDGRQALLYGVIVNHYEPFQGGGRGTLKEATDDLAGQIARSNTYLRRTGIPQSIRTGGARGYSVRLAGTSPLTGQTEQVLVVTRALPDGHVMYALGIVPGSETARFNPVFTRMLQSLRVNDGAAHRN